jgi:hypothetical protein
MARSENGWLVNVIIQFLQYQKDRVNRKEITGSTLRNYVKVVKLFCEMDDLYVPWKKLTRGLPRAKNYAADRVPRLDEIQKIVANDYDPFGNLRIAPNHTNPYLYRKALAQLDWNRRFQNQNLRS